MAKADKFMTNSQATKSWKNPQKDANTQRNQFRKKNNENSTLTRYDEVKNL